MLVAVNGESAVLWLGASVSPKLLEDLWAVDDLDQVDPRMVSGPKYAFLRESASTYRSFAPCLPSDQSTLPRLPTPISKQLRAILAHFATLAGHTLPLVLARQNKDGSELEFANMLIEDNNNGEMAYKDCESSPWMVSMPVLIFRSHPLTPNFYAFVHSPSAAASGC